MNQAKVSYSDEGLNKLKKEFEIWRTTRESRRPIPEKLWDKAIGLYPVYTINKISKELHLNYSDLKKRVQHNPDHIPMKQAEKSAFIELDFPPDSPVSECIIEMEDKSGAKMKMCFRGKTDFDLLELGKSFWNKNS